MNVAELPWDNKPKPLEKHVAIERYRALGFALVPIREKSKAPFLGDWQNDPILADSNERLHFFDGKFGVGINHYFSRTATLDVDWLEATKRLFREFGFDYDALMAGYPRIRTREGKDKILFRVSEELAQSGGKKVLQWPDESGECDENGKPIMLVVMELRTGKNQDVLPPSIHPDTLAPYEWHEGQAPWDYPELPELPADHFLLTIWREWDRFKPQLESACPWWEHDPIPPIPEPIRQVARTQHNDIIGQFNRSYPADALLERNGYIKKGRRWLAPHSRTKIPGVVVLKDTGKAFSHHGSDILCTGHAHDSFSLLTILECNGSMDVAIEAAARALGIDRFDPVNVDIDFDAFTENTKKRTKAKKSILAKTVTHEPNPDLLSQAPTWVRAFLDWGLSTAAKPLPHLTLQAAFATLSAAASRKYRTNLNNWPTLWFLNSELTASGKEHPESLIELALEAANLGHLLAGAGYTSPGAIFSVLMDRPAHVALIDEFGKLMASSQSKGNQHKADAITLLMQAFSSCHKTLRPPAYSAMGLSKEQRQDLMQRKVCNPAITLFASTTPSTFFSSIDHEWINDGFLGRFMVCNSRVGRQKSIKAPRREPDASLVESLQMISAGNQDEGAGNLAGFEFDCTIPANPEDMTFSAEAEKLLDAFEDDIHRRMDSVQRWGLDPLFGRTREKAMRLSMLVALADDPGARVIGSAAAEYAIAYVLDMDAGLVESAKMNVADSPFARVKNTCQTVLQQAGARGLTKRELERKIAAFNALKPKEQMDVLGALASSGLIEPRDIESKTGRGRKRSAWVAIEEENE